jgi:hypothetical protein
MGFIGTCFQKLDGWIDGFSIEVFASIVKPAWIDKALEATQRESIRTRKLPARFVVWLAISMGFYRQLSIRNILNRLGNLPGVGSLWDDGKEPSSGSGVEARDRVGFGPLRHVALRFQSWIVETYRELMSWKGLLVLALDGTTFKLSDSDQNRRRFGLPGASRGRAAFPQMRALFLVSAKLRFILGAWFAPFRRAEITLALRMVGSLPEACLVLLDRGFNAWPLLLGIRQGGNHFLVRAKSNMHGEMRGILGPGDRLVEMRVRRHQRPSGAAHLKSVLVRELTVRIRGRAYRFLTSLLETSTYSAVELVHLYAQRWEEEIAIDEIKTHQCGATTVSRPVIFRCKTSRRVLQEAYGLVIAYNLVRTMMTDSGVRFGVDPLRISFVDSVERMRNAALVMAAAPTPCLPAIFADLMRSIAQCVLPPRRRRDNPRAVCVKVSAYNLKKKAS